MTQKEMMNQLKKSDNKQLDVNKFTGLESIKEVSNENSDQRKFSGWLSTYDNIDSEGDIFEKGAFKEAIKKRDTYPLLFNHKGYDLDDYIGEMVLTDTEYGVWFDATLYENDKNADKVYKLLKSGALQEMSIGFRIEDYEKDLEFVEDENRPWGFGFNFKKSLIREGSVVLAPANLSATIEEVKNKKSEYSITVAETNLDEKAIQEIVKEVRRQLNDDKSVNDSKLELEDCPEDESITKQKLLEDLENISKSMKGKI